MNLLDDCSDEIRSEYDQIATPAGSIAANGGSLEARIHRVMGLPVGSPCDMHA